MDREIQMSHNYQPYKTLDPNDEMIEVKWNPELNFVYVDVRNKNTTPLLKYEGEFNEN